MFPAAKFLAHPVHPDRLIIANFLLAPIVNINVLLFVDILSALALIFFLDSKKSREKSQRFAERK